MKNGILMLMVFSFAIPVFASQEEEQEGEATVYERYEEISGEEVSRIRYRRDPRWIHVNESSIVMRTGPNGYWLLDLDENCVNRVPRQVRLVEDDEQGRQAGRREIAQHDSLALDEFRCRIHRIRSLDPDGVAEIREEHKG